MRNVLFVALIAVVLFLSGCQGGETTNTVGDTTSFIGGSDALKFSFVDSAPASEVIEKTPFGVTLQVENAGEAQVNQNAVLIEISGIVPSDFGKTTADMTKTSSTDLFAKKKTIDNQVTPGTQAYIDFGTYTYATDLQGNMPFTLNAKACYAYYTNAVTKMCVRKDLLGATVDPGKGCVVKGDKAVQNSGAPVQISALSETPSGKDRVSFTFSIEKVGAGDVFKYGGPITCDDTDMATKNKVLFTVDTGLPGLICDAIETPYTYPAGSSPTQYGGYVTLFSGKRTVTCTQVISADKMLDFEKVVNMKLDYLYSEVVSKNIVVKNVN